MPLFSRSQVSRSLLALLSAGVVMQAADAAARTLCVDRDFDENVRFDVEIGWDRPNPLDPNPEPVTADPDKLKFIDEVKSLDGGWQTPSSIWPTSSVVIEMRARGLVVCQVAYSDSAIFVMDRDLNGFVTRSLTRQEYRALDEAMGFSVRRVF